MIVLYKGLYLLKKILVKYLKMKGVMSEMFQNNPVSLSGQGQNKNCVCE